MAIPGLQKSPRRVIITAYMYETHKTMKVKTDKAALLGLLIVGLLAARFIVESRYSKPTEAGRQVIEQVKSRGVADLLVGRPYRSFFLIKNERGGVLGFTMDVLVESKSETQFNIRGAGLFYMLAPQRREQVTFFQADNS